MYSGSTLTNKSGNILGAHQKINRVSRKALSSFLLEDNKFPSKKLLLHFEGKNGPDGIITKSRSGVHMTHYYDPFDPEDTQLLEALEEHWTNLSKELSKQDITKAAFEASWLAHLVVDGLTPSHHYPYEQEMQNSTKNADNRAKRGLKRAIITGDSTTQKIANNWQFWGAKGIMTTHSMFEIGSATIIKPLPARIAIPNKYELKLVDHLGFLEYYKRVARDIALLDIYDMFYKRGWSQKVSKLIKKELAPKMASTVTIAWYTAAKKAGLTHR